MIWIKKRHTGSLAYEVHWNRVRRRSLLAAAAVARGQTPATPAASPATLADAPLADGVTITVERRDDTPPGPVAIGYGVRDAR